MPVIRLNAKNKTITLRKSTNAITLKQVGRRGIQGPKGDKGDKGDQGDPATNLVQSVNGKQGVVVLNPSDVGADPTGSAAQALADAKDYTDTEVSTLDSSLATVAKTGSYDDLSNKPTIPSIAGLATEAQVQDVQDNLDAHEADTANPHNVTKAQVGLGNIDNTSDANKPVSTAQQTALDTKVDKSSTANVLYGRNTANVEAAIPMTESAATPWTIPRRDNAGRIKVVTGVATEDAVNKAQMDTADALKVNKAGDTMTGGLTVATGGVSVNSGGTSARMQGNNGAWQLVDVNAGSYRLHRSSAGLWVGNNTNLVTPLQMLHVDGNARINGVDYLTGTGFPNGVVSAPVGSTYIDTNTTNGAIEWKKATGTGNTGWVVSVGDTGWRNITADLISGWTGSNSLLVRRVGATVELKFVQIADTTATSPRLLAAISFGFRPGIITGNPAAVGTITPSVTAYPINTARVFMDIYGDVYANTSRPTATTFSGSLIFDTINSWPATLPGTAA